MHVNLEDFFQIVSICYALSQKIFIENLWFIYKFQDTCWDFRYKEGD